VTPSKSSGKPGDSEAQDQFELPYNVDSPPTYGLCYEMDYYGYGHGYAYGYGSGYYSGPYSSGGTGASSSYAWVPVHRRAPQAASDLSDAGDIALPGTRLGRPLRAIYLGPCLARGGAEIWLTNLARFLDPSRVCVLRAVVLDPHRIEPGYAEGFPLPIEAGGDAVDRAVGDCDVLLSWGLQLPPVLNGHRPPLSVFIAHGDGWFTRDLVAANAAHVDHVVAVSRRVRELTCKGTPATVIHNGVDTARLACTLARDEVRRGLGFDREDFVVGYLGRLAIEKRVDLILRAVADLPPRFKALVVGWGPMLPHLAAMANRLLPGRAHFVTAADYLGDYYRAMDAFCNPSDTEGTPLTMLEAMFSEVPVLATPVGAVPELVEDRVTGLIITQSSESIACAAQLLATRPHWACGLTAQARATADRVGHGSRMAREYEALLTYLWIQKFGAACPQA
jgi:glycosyltransferase involved in cell wall biosynthesis